jgi:hypothetical protein
MVTRLSVRGVASLLLAGAFVAFIATQSPHLVHHFFEPELVQDECPFAANGERTGWLPIEPVAVAATAEVSTPLLPAVLPAATAVARDATRSRAPPAPVS